VAVLPRLAHTAESVREAGQLGFEILLHLPMEPLGGHANDPGPGALLAAMPPALIRAVLREDLASVPGAVGVNNHMGSRFTADARALEPLMTELETLGLFFLDSRTTPRSQAFAAAQRHGVPAAQRTVFLDDTEDPQLIRAQVEKLLRLARERGSAIGIGHPHPATIEVLAGMRERLRAAGVEWVPVSALAGRPRRAGETPAAAPPPGRRAVQTAARER